MDHVISEPCYKGTTLQRNYREMAILWSFSYKSFVKFLGKIFGSHNDTLTGACFVLKFDRKNQIKFLHKVYR